MQARPPSSPPWWRRRPRSCRSPYWSPVAPATRPRRPPVAAGRDLRETTAADDDTIHIPGCLLDQREKPADPGPGRDDHRRGRGRQRRRRAGTERRDGRLRHRAPRHVDRQPRQDVHGQDRQGHAARGRRAPQPRRRSPRADAEPRRATSSSPSRSATQAPPAPARACRRCSSLVGGLVFALLLAMAALGLSMIFGTTGLTNFAHGELITFGALVAYGVDSLPGTIRIGGTNITVVVAVIVATIASAGFGWLNDWALWRPLRRRGTGLIAMMMVSIGLSIFLRNVYQYFAGASKHHYSQFASPTSVGDRARPGHAQGPLRRRCSRSSCWSPWSSRCSAPGSARPPARSRTTPALSAATGINVDRVISVVWIVGAALAGLSGVLLGMTQGFDYQLGLQAPAAGLRRRRARRASARSGAPSWAPWSSASSSRCPRCSSRPSSSSSVPSSYSSSSCCSGRRACSARPSESAEERQHMDWNAILSQSLQQGLGPVAAVVLPGRHRPQRALRLHRTAQLRSGRLHGRRRLRRGVVRRDLGPVASGSAASSGSWPPWCSR